jgi:hypothetical protein
MRDWHAGFFLLVLYHAVINMKNTSDTAVVVRFEINNMDTSLDNREGFN